MGYASDHGYPVTPTFAVMPHARRKATEHGSKAGSGFVKQAANGETRTAILKKKLMNTNLSGEAAAPANAVQQSSKLHQANRGLSTEKVLNYLRTQLPQKYELAEVVGKWVWLAVSPKRQPHLAKVLWGLGFHWNQRRGVWQHPCGKFDPLGSHPRDPRTKYHTFYPADVLPA